MKQENNNYNSINYFHILTIVFIVLKLCKIINWHWFFVLLPSIISIIVTIIIIIIVFIIMIIANDKLK